MLQMPNWVSMLTIFFFVSMAGCSETKDQAKAKYSKHQQLVIAAFELDVDRVQGLLAEGADPNTWLGYYDEHLFEDKWSLGLSHVASDKWTPLLAVANSHREPQPEKRTENTTAGRQDAETRFKLIDSSLIAERDKRRVAIARLLIKAKAYLDLDDGYGGTALAASVYNGYDDLSLLLIESNAKINTRTGVYIDGVGDITPLHRATNSPKVLEAMIRRGANVNVADSSGDTPLHLAVRGGNVASVKLLLDAGADITATDEEGLTPSYWCESYRESTFPGDEDKKEIARLLDAATEQRDLSKYQVDRE
jgi:ankyrin repeat protein